MAWTVQLLALWTLCATTPGAKTSTDAPRLRLALELAPVVLDYELPGHPNTPGRGHVGALAKAALLWTPNPYVEIEVGVLGRLPFALDPEDQADAWPVLSVAGRPVGDRLILRFGSLDVGHGYHGALVDEPRYAYGRNVQETYNRSLPAAARRDLGGDPFGPAEHGAQLLAKTELGRVEVFLDWQLLETAVHREKFNFGLLGAIETDWFDIGLQFRLTHYGGQLFTRGDPIRAGGLDPVRQPESAAIVCALRVLRSEIVTVELHAVGVSGHLRQAPGGEEQWHFGGETGVDLHLFEAARAGYRLWLPRAGRAGFVSEDGDPVYSGPRAHRATVGLSQRIGGLEIDGRLDLVFAEGADKVQYLAVTLVRYRWEADLLDASSKARTQ